MDSAVCRIQSFGVQGRLSGFPEIRSAEARQSVSSDVNAIPVNKLPVLFPRPSQTESSSPGLLETCYWLLIWVRPGRRKNGLSLPEASEAGRTPSVGGTVTSEREAIREGEDILDHVPPG